MMNQSNDTKSISNFLIQANEFRNKRNYQKALIIYLELYEHFGKNIDLFTTIASCNFALDNFEEAVSWVEKAIILAPNDDYLRVKLGEYYSIGLNDYERDVWECRQAIELNPNNVKAFVSIAAIYGVPERVVTLDEAIICLERATELEPDDPNYHFRLGKFYHEADRLLDRDREWNKALLCSQALDPGPTNRIKAALNINDIWQKIKNQFLPDKRQVALLIRANELKRQRNYQEVLAVYLKLYKHIGEDVDLITMIAFCNLALNNFKEAVGWGEKAISLAPDNEHLHIDLGEYYSIGLNDYERAVRKYRQAIELNPNSVRALVGVASLYGVPEKVVTLDEAIICLERATELEPDDPNYHFRLGKFYYEANRPLEQDREWNKALLCSQPLDPGPTNKIKTVLSSSLSK